MNRIHKTVELEEGKAKVDIYVKKTSHEVIKRSDRYKAKTWNQCIRDGVITKKELSVLMESGVFGIKKKLRRKRKRLRKF